MTLIEIQQTLKSFRDANKLGIICLTSLELTKLSVHQEFMDLPNPPPQFQMRAVNFIEELTEKYNSAKA